MKNLKLTAYNDPGHGWVRVSHALILELGIADKISPYSYMTNTSVYLEEDCDYGVFYTAAKEAGYTLTVTDKYSNSNSQIRNYGRYRAELVGGPKIGDVVTLHTGTTCRIIDEITGYYIVDILGTSYRVSKKRWSDIVL